MRRSLPVVFAALVLGAVALVQTPSRSAPATETFKIDPVHSVVLFRIQHLGAGQFYGRFNSLAGSVSVTEGGMGAVDLTVDVESVDTANEKRNGHLKSPDFFNAKQFATITFKSSALRHVEGNRFEAKGTLTLHGVSKEITVPVERTGTGRGMKGESLAGFEATFTIQRSDYGMNFMQGPLGDEVRIIVSVEGSLQS